MLDRTLGHLFGCIVLAGYALFTLAILVIPLLADSTVAETALDGARYWILAVPALVLTTGLSIVGVVAGLALALESDPTPPTSPHVPSTSDAPAAPRPETEGQVDVAKRGQKGVRLRRSSRQEMRRDPTVVSTAASTASLPS